MWDLSTTVLPVNFRGLFGNLKKRPLIYVGMGSSGSARILAAVLRQLSTAPVDVLVGDGVLLSDADARSLGHNIHRAGTVPAHLLAGRIDA